MAAFPARTVVWLRNLEKRLGDGDSLLLSGRTMGRIQAATTARHNHLGHGRARDTAEKIGRTIMGGVKRSAESGDVASAGDGSSRAARSSSPILRRTRPAGTARDEGSAATTPAPAVHRAAFKNCRLRSGRYGALRHASFPACAPRSAIPVALQRYPHGQALAAALSVRVHQHAA